MYAQVRVRRTAMFSDGDAGSVRAHARDSYPVGKKVIGDDSDKDQASYGWRLMTMRTRIPKNTVA
jgi:hypothetical protein